MRLDDFEELVQRASCPQEEALQSRARAEDDREIATKLKLRHKNVPVLVTERYSPCGSYWQSLGFRPL
jgi:hypothetical protein